MKNAHRTMMIHSRHISERHPKCHVGRLSVTRKVLYNAMMYHMINKVTSTKNTARGFFIGTGHLSLIKKKTYPVLRRPTIAELHFCL